MNARDNYIAFSTIVRKEVTRFTRIWTQTLLPPAITQSLYFIIFGKFVGSRIGEVQGISYMGFIVPGLVMMALINSSFANVVSSFFSSKFQRSIEELLVSPTPDWIIIAGYVAGGVLRGLIVGAVVFFISIFFVRPHIFHLGIILVFAVLTTLLFSLSGLTNGIFAKKFPLAEVASYKTVKNHWYYGWGIRLWLWPYMWVYNVSGFDAVELTMKNGRIYRIGTDEPQELATAIAQARGDGEGNK